MSTRYAKTRLVHGGAIALCCFLTAAAAPARAGQTLRVSVASDGTQADDESSGFTLGGLSASGKVAVFNSEATNLVSGDTNAVRDIFVRDLARGETTRVSVAGDGTEGNGASGMPTISANGRWVAFQSAATNLVAGDTNAQPDVFRHDRKTGLTERMSVNSAGIECNGGAGFAAISGNGRAVVFDSTSTNLVPDDTNSSYDVFHHDAKSAATVRVSVASDGSEANDASLYPVVSASGKVVAFLSAATNLVAGDNNATADVFVRDLRRGTTTRASVASDGTEANDGSSIPAISANGRWVAFTSPATNLVSGDGNGKSDAFVHDLATGETTRVSVASDGTEADDDSGAISISGNGRFVIFTSSATNLVQADTNGVDDVFVHDRKTGETVRVNVDGAGVQSSGSIGFDLSLSASGKRALLSTDAGTLVIGDTNGVSDIFVHDLK